MIYLIDHEDSFTYNLAHLLDDIEPTFVSNYYEINKEKLEKSSTIVFSPGPGEPKNYPQTTRIYKKYKAKKKILGICLGHQILSLALGAKTFKLKFGHRGINHPVRNNNTSTVEITSQNHGFAVDLDSLPKNVTSTHINLNDNTSAGIMCKDYSAFSVQYHPESSPGPHDSRYLFKQFIDMMRK